MKAFNTPKDDLGFFFILPNHQGLARYPAECVYEYEGSSETGPTDLEVDCTNKRMASSSWGPFGIFYDEDKKIFTSYITPIPVGAVGVAIA